MGIKRRTEEEIVEILREAQSVCNWWREVYNYFRPHSSINDKTPVEFAQGTDFASLRQPPELDRKMVILN